MKVSTHIFPSYDSSEYSKNSIKVFYYNTLSKINLDLTDLPDEENLKNFNLVIITEENMLNYTSFPDYILDKYKRNIIDPTHFSDLIRLELLI